MFFIVNVKATAAVPQPSVAHTWGAWHGHFGKTNVLLTLQAVAMHHYGCAQATAACRAGSARRGMGDERTGIAHTG